MKAYVRGSASFRVCALALAAAAAVACSRTPSGSNASAGGGEPTEGGASTGGATTAASGHASSGSAASGGVGSDAGVPRAAAPPNLLALVPSKVAVSSTVVNPRDFPEHLLDGDPGTAWNSRTGDLKGWIAFRVPADAHVDRIELTSGFDKVGEAGDLFTANHRIVRVAVSRDGKKIMEAALDPNVRGLQPLAVNVDGGDFRVDVLETLPGTKTAWKELVVSELRVVGTPGKARRTGKEPLRVGTGSLDAEPQAFDWQDAFGKTEGPYADVAAACAAFVAGQAKAKPAFETDPPLVPQPAVCGEAPAGFSFTPGGPYKSVHVVARQTRFAGKGLQLVVETDKGFWLAPITWAVREDPGDPGCPSIVREELVESVRVDNGHLVVVYAGARATLVDGKAYPEDDGFREVLVRGAFWGKPDASGRPAFRHWNPQYQQALGTKTQPDGRRDKRVPWATLPWADAQPFHVDKAGALRIQG